MSVFVCAHNALVCLSGQAKSYRLAVLRRLTHLRRLDGQLVSGEERAAAAENSSSLGIPLIRRHARGPGLAPPPPMSTMGATMPSAAVAVAGSSGDTSLEPSTSSVATTGEVGAEVESWWSCVEQLDLNHQRCVSKVTF